MRSEEQDTVTRKVKGRVDHHDVTKPLASKCHTKLRPSTFKGKRKKKFLKNRGESNRKW